MRRPNWRKTWLTMATLGTFASGVVWAEPPANVVVIREPGQPEHRCVIEKTTTQADGKSVYQVRDLATGDRMRVVDNRTSKNGKGPILGKLISRLTEPSDADMTQALAGSPVNSTTLPRRPTTADLARGSASPSPAGKFRPAEPAHATARP